VHQDINGAFGLYADMVHLTGGSFGNIEIKNNKITSKDGNFVIQDDGTITASGTIESILILDKDTNNELKITTGMTSKDIYSIKTDDDDIVSYLRFYNKAKNIKGEEYYNFYVTDRG
jgi:hypothetical protein